MKERTGSFPADGVPSFGDARSSTAAAGETSQHGSPCPGPSCPIAGQARTSVGDAAEAAAGSSTLQYARTAGAAANRIVVASAKANRKRLEPIMTI
jgi:hypothetical protein